MDVEHDESNNETNFIQWYGHMDILNFLKTNWLFSDLTDEQLKNLISISEVKTIPANTYVVKEGATDRDAYIILEGEVEILKRHEKIEHHLSILKVGETFGEMGFIDSGPRSASVKTLKEVQLLVIPFSRIQIKYQQIINNIAKVLTKRLRDTNEVTVKSLQAELIHEKTRIQIGKFFMRLLTLLCIWIFLLSLMTQLAKTFSSSRAILSTGITIALLIMVLEYVIKGIYPPSFYGLTLARWKKNVLTSFLIGISFIAASLIVKNVLLYFFPPQRHVPWFELRFSYLSLVYILFVPVQEFIARGVMQSTLYVFFAKRSPFPAIFVASLLFSVFHVQLGFYFVIFTFFLGLFWGWMYYKQKSLIGPIISHIMIGAWPGFEIGIFQMALKFSLPH